MSYKRQNAQKGTFSSWLMYSKQGKHSPHFVQKEGDFTLNIRYDD